MNQEDFYKDVIFWAVILNSIGLLPIVTFIARIWYSTQRATEKIVELKEDNDKLKEELKDINEQRHSDNENFAKIIYEMKLALNNLNSTLQGLAGKFKTINRKEG